MIIHAISQGDITSKEFILFQKMKTLVEKLPDLSWGEISLSCHHICYALADIFELTVATGYFGYAFEHSWLPLRYKKDEGVVIADMYPVAATPFLVYAYAFTPWAPLYTPHQRVLDSIRTTEADFDTHVTEVRVALTQYL